MNSRIRKILEILLICVIAGASVLIFVFRNRIGEVGTVGYAGLFGLCFLANATVLLPSPSLMIAASCALIMNPLLVALAAALGSSAGELVGYAFGTVTRDLSPKWKGWLDRLAKKVRGEVFLVFILALLPLPLFDFVGIYSGGTKMNLVKFYVACFLGKFLKMLVYTRMYELLEWGMSVLGM